MSRAITTIDSLSTNDHPVGEGLWFTLSLEGPLPAPRHRVPVEVTLEHSTARMPPPPGYAM